MARELHALPGFVLAGEWHRLGLRGVFEDGGFGFHGYGEVLQWGVLLVGLLRRSTEADEGVGRGPGVRPTKNAARNGGMAG
jgi:hypothetical protein